MPEFTLEKLKIDERLRRVEEAMAGNKVLLSNMADTLTTLSLKVGVQNGRVGKLENWKSWITGGLSAFAAVMSLAALIRTFIK